jgi:cytochrome P450
MPTAITNDFTLADLVQPDVIRNPYPYYEHLREQPIQFGLKDWPPGTIPGADEPFPAWALFKYEDVAAAARNHEVFSSRDPMQEASSAPTLMLVNHDKPEHTRLRSIAQRAFSPTRVLEDVAPWAEATIATMFDELPAHEMDFMESFSVQIPARFLTRLIGTPEEDWERLRDWGNAFMVTSNYIAAQRQASNEELAAYYADHVQQRYALIEQGGPVPDDLMSAFIQTDYEGEYLTPEEVTRFCITLAVAGAETTVYYLGNLVATLIEWPDLYEALQNDRSLVRPFMEESLRRDGPPQRLFRVCTQDIELGGAQMRKGDWVALFFASANRDPSVFENPDEFDMQRENIKRHLTFGHGIHHCMGSVVARMEADKLLNGILDRVARIEATGAIERQSGGLLNYGIERMPVRFVMK